MPLTHTQHQTLQAAISRIIPTDDAPGAAEAGTIHYITGQFSRDFRDKVPTYQSGLDALDAEALARYHLSFTHISPDQQDALLTDVEHGNVHTPWAVSSPDFFTMLVNHTSEGFYGDPQNGGNHSGVSWEMIGF